MAQTGLSNKIKILKDFWNGYLDDESFKDFIFDNNTGLPLAHLVFYNHAIISTSGEKLINDTWNNFLEYLDTEDTGFEDLNDIYFVSEN